MEANTLNPYFTEKSRLNFLAVFVVGPPMSGRQLAMSRLLRAKIQTVFSHFIPSVHLRACQTIEANPGTCMQSTTLAAKS